MLTFYSFLRMAFMSQTLRTINDLLKYSADRFGENACIKYVENKEVVTKTYNDMYADSLAEALYLCSELKPRSHIAVIGKTSYRFLTYYNAVFMCGGVAVPLGTDFSEEDIICCINKADVNAVIYDDSVAEKINRVGFAPGTKLINLSAEHPVPTVSELPEANPGDMAMIMFTSGTTGDKKGVMLSQDGIISNVLFKEMSYEGGHIALNVLPMHHIFCFSCDYLKNLKDGVTICLNGDPGNINENLLRFEPTVIRLVPMMIASLLRKARIIKNKYPELTEREAAERVFGRNLRSVIASGAYLDPALAADYEKMGISVRQGYGMTETGPRIAVPNGKTDFFSAGAVIDICEVRIENGEIQVKSPSLMLGYYKDDEATKAVFTPDGWFMTGDIGYMKPDRSLYITGRKKNLIILSNGENISPEEIEKKLGGDSAVSEVLVYGEKDRLTAEFYISPEYAAENGAEKAREHMEIITAQYNAGVESTKEIANIKFRDTPFEKTSSGKIKRNQIIF